MNAIANEIQEYEELGGEGEIRDESIVGCTILSVNGHGRHGELGISNEFSIDTDKGRFVSITVNGFLGHCVDTVLGLENLIGQKVISTRRTFFGQEPGQEMGIDIFGDPCQKATLQIFTAKGEGSISMVDDLGDNGHLLIWFLVKDCPEWTPEYPAVKIESDILPLTEAELKALYEPA